MTDLMDGDLTADTNAPRKDTGIYVRARLAGKFATVDISQLDKASLLAWLRERGGSNRRAENVVGELLGVGRLHGLMSIVTHDDQLRLQRVFNIRIEIDHELMALNDRGALMQYIFSEFERMVNAELARMQKT